MQVHEFYAAMAMRELIRKQLGDFEESDYKEIALQAAKFAIELQKQTEFLLEAEIKVRPSTETNDVKFL